MKVAARGVSQIPFGATSSPIEDPFGVSFIPVAMYVDDGAGGSVVDAVNGGEAGSRMVVQATGCTEKMKLANSDELQRRRNGVVERGLSWCGSGGSMCERRRGCC